MSGGPIRTTTNLSWAPDSKTPSWDHVWPRASSSKRSVYNQNSQTPLLERESESCSRKTERRSLPSYHGTDVSTISLKMTRSWSLASVKRADPRVIFPVLDSRSSQSRASPSLPCLLEKNKRNDPHISIINLIFSLITMRLSPKSLYTVRPQGKELINHS